MNVVAIFCCKMEKLGGAKMVAQDVKLAHKRKLEACKGTKANIKDHMNRF